MAEIRNRNSVQVNEAGKQKLIEAKAAKRNYEGKLWTYLDIATAAFVSEKTVKRFFAGKEDVDYESAIAIASSLNLELAELIDPKSDPPPSPPETRIDWRDICHKMLEEQLRRYQFRRQATGTGLGHEVGIYVPLGLVKPTTQPRRGEEFCPSPDEGRLQYQLSEKEIEKRFEAGAFLQQVIEAGEGKTIAIIGEPGAGKSTWLEQIARHLKDSENVSRLPICIQLGSLDGKTLEEYLLQVWLKEALSLQGMRVSAQMETELMQLFNSHQVWLLLDGVDEMRAGTSTGANSPLQGIANQLRGWVAQAQTLLTCRLNVWQANDRVVPNCDVYRTLDFDDSQVGEFIGEWFAKAGEPQLGKQLGEKLGESGQERIRDLIRNPLRLALLCQTWAVKQGELPKTKATLYQRFREDFYEWKKNEFPIGWQQRQELNAALGRLAVAAIEKQTPLRESLAYEQMGESLFELARQIGWLNLVYRDGETDEPVYAFYHLTFQEYFAALAIDDWHFFLTHDNDNPQPLPGNVYRIFEPQWREVILLWLGREDVEREQKEQFIQALIEFEDRCRNFYGYQAYFLASSGVAEFQDCRWTDEIVAQIVKWGFGYFNIDKQEWRTYLTPIEAGAIASLLQTNCGIAVNKLIDLLETAKDEYTCISAADALGKIDPGNKQAIATLLDLLQTTNNEWHRLRAAQSLRQIAPNNPKAITALLDLLHTTQNEWLCWKTAWNLRQVDPENPQAIAALLDLLRTSQDEQLRWNAASELGEIGADHPKVIMALLELTYRSQNVRLRLQAAWSLGKIAANHPKAILALLRLLQTGKAIMNLFGMLRTNQATGADNLKGIVALVDLLYTSQDEDIRRQAAWNLVKVAADQPEVAAALFDLYYNSHNDENYRKAAWNLLEKVGADPSEGIVAFLDLLHTTQDEWLRQSVAWGLGKIDPNNPKVIAALVNLLHTTQDERTRWKTADTLGEINRDNPEVIAAFLDLLRTSQDENIPRWAAQSLGEIAADHPEVIKALLDLLRTSQDENIHHWAAYGLKKVFRIQALPVVVLGLKDYLSSDIWENNYERSRDSYGVIWQCAQTLPYPVFYQAWHHPPINPHPEVAETTEVSFTPFTQCHNLAVLPELLHAAINNDPHLREKVQPICIDGSKFENPDNPASEIYAEMVMQGFPERQNGEPETMQALKVYCQLKCQDGFLIFYEDTSGEILQGFSPTFLSSLSKFVNARRICVVSEQPCNLQTFSPTQPNLVADIVNWIREKMMED